MTITKNMRRARNGSSAISRAKPSRFDWLIWGAINKNTTKRNNLANVKQTDANVDLSATGSTTTVKGALTVSSDATFNANLKIDKGVVEYNSGHKHGYLRATKALPVTAAAHTDITLGVLPANCRIVNLILSTDSIITTSGSSGGGDDLDFSLGTAAQHSAGSGQIIVPKHIANDGGSAVSIDASTTYFIVKDGRPTAINALDATGVANASGGTTNNPVTSEAIVLAASHISTTADRTIVARLTPLANNLAATGNVTVILEFMTA